MVVDLIVIQRMNIEKIYIQILVIRTLVRSLSQEVLFIVFFLIILPENNSIVIVLHIASRYDNATIISSSAFVSFLI